MVSSASVSYGKGSKMQWSLCLRLNLRSLSHIVIKILIRKPLIPPTYTDFGRLLKFYDIIWNLS